MSMNHHVPSLSDSHSSPAFAGRISPSVRGAGSANECQTTDFDDTHSLRQRLQTWCGVRIGPEKSYLLSNRLRPLMQELGVSTYQQLLELAEGGLTGRANPQMTGTQIRDRIVDALTTHETLFFRDRSPFDALKSHVIPEIASNAGHRRNLRIWSAACSTGQEPYSIVMSLVDAIPDIASWQISITATDVSQGTIELAKQGRYQDHEVRRGITASQCDRFFSRDGNVWVIKSSIRQMVRFAVGDLTSSPQPAGPFDVIFCRNVLIYFPPEVAERVLRNLVSKLSKDGRLFLGCSEIPHDCDDVLRTERLGLATCFRRK